MENLLVPDRRNLSSLAFHPALAQTPIIEFLMDLPETELRAIAQEHALGGLLAQFENSFSEQNTKTEFLKYRQLQMQKNILFF